MSRRPHRRRPVSTAAPKATTVLAAMPHARWMAYEVLTEFDQSRPTADDDDQHSAPQLTRLMLTPLTRLAPVPDQERRLAGELIRGIVRRRATLAAILEKFVSRPRANIEDGLWRLLELGTYQLVLLSGIPPHAAVSETVLLTKQIGKPQWAGFLNGVLRNIGRELTTDVEEQPTRQGVPLVGSPSEAASIRYRQMASDIFPDPQAEPADYLAAAFSFPNWLVESWLSRYGWDEALRLAAWFNSPGQTTLRVNLLQSDRNRLLALLADNGIEASPGDVPTAIRLSKPMAIETLPGYQAGWFSVQDESAQQVASLLDPQPGERILDLCAGPGGKTTHLAERMGNAGEVAACDIWSIRIRSIIDNRDRLGLTCIQEHTIAADGERTPDGPFDAALVDVPCSNTGVLGKRPDVRWRIGPRDLTELPELQARLLRTAIERVRSGGRIVYSTCSIEPQENEQLVRRVLQSTPGLKLIREQHHRPGFPGDGGYQSLLHRT
ncbi:MAG: 16S rRNA (cytosine(967)-C(5))-methyltransferase RsmB [Planctomycetaceae bacterium]